MIKNFILGLLFASLGAALYSQAGLGMDAFSTFSLGIAIQTGLSFGTACLISGLMLLAVLFMLDRRQVRIGGVLYAFGLGLCIDGWLWVLNHWGIELPSLLMLTVGVALFALGIAHYIRANIGSGAVEAFVTFLCGIFQKKMWLMRIIADAGFLVAGILLSAQFGWGTVIGVVAMGPLVNLFLTMLAKTPQFVPETSD